ncbi:MAG: type II secretion system inner membrane protein GspF [Gammaproteobacteria bacterium]|nr:type II secretion system inner membrane protein GspF [Gammaproteobacteria bacterium]
MAAFEYAALDGNGKQSKGVLEADSARHLRQILRDQGLTPLEVTAATERNNSGFSFSFNRSMSGLDRVLFTRQLATLVGSSLPIEEALAAVAQQTEKQFVSALIMGIRSKVLEGHSLASSLREYSSSFNNLYCSSIAAGEQSGHLDRVLENLANYQERQFESTRNVEMALFYPVALLILAFVIVGALMVYVVPDLITVIEGTGSELPWFTVLLIGMTNGLRDYWWALLLGISGIVMAIRWALRQPNLRLKFDKQKFSIPMVRRISRSANAARYANTLSILTGAGVPLVEAMSIASEVVSNTWLKRGLQQATQTVSEGMSLRVSLEQVGQFPPMLLHMVGSGEQSGELDQMLGRVAAFQQAEVERIVSTMVKLFEPIMLLIMGAVVLFIVMAILLPILSINTLV